MKPIPKFTRDSRPPSPVLFTQQKRGVSGGWIFGSGARTGTGTIIYPRESPRSGREGSASAVERRHGDLPRDYVDLSSRVPRAGRGGIGNGSQRWSDFPEDPLGVRRGWSRVG